jgi:hypothetical protein
VIIDGREVDALARSFTTAPAKVIPSLVPVAKNAGNKIKNGLRREASGHRRLPHLQTGISYEVNVTRDSVSVEVGWHDPAGQQNLANIIAFGTSDTPAHMDITKPLRDEVPAFTRWVAKVAAEAL